MTILHFPEISRPSSQARLLSQPLTYGAFNHRSDFNDRTEFDHHTAGVSISCSDCIMLNTSACNDCVVTLLCEARLGGMGGARTRHVELSDSEAAVVDVFAAVGLTPRSRHVGRPLAG
jgi:hypothetical protein